MQFLHQIQKKETLMKNQQNLPKTIWQQTGLKGVSFL
jgi:hypothetical protein